MSKIYEKYVELKSSTDCKENTLYLFKAGLFFIFIDKDASIASDLLHLKLGHLNDKIVKCGFPCNSLQKYLNLLKNTFYKVEIVSVDKSKTFSAVEFVHAENIKKIIDEFLEIDINSLSISQAYDVLYNLQNNISSAKKDH